MAYATYRRSALLRATASCASSADAPRRLALAALLLAIGVSLLPAADALAREILRTTPYSALTLAWFRFAFGAAALLPLLLARCPKARVPLGLVEIARAGCLALAITLMIVAVSRAPMADAAGAFFICPAASAALSAIFLRERVAALEWAAIGLGFIGVMLVVKPGFGLTLGHLSALCAGLSYAVFLTLTRRAASREPGLWLLASQMMLGLGLLAPVAAPDFLAHGLQAAPLLLYMGAASFGCNLLLVIAYRFAPAAMLAPFVYFQILSATLIGGAAYGVWPDSVATLGLLLTVASGCLVSALRRSSASRARATPPRAPRPLFDAAVLRRAYAPAAPRAPLHAQ